MILRMSRGCMKSFLLLLAVALAANAAVVTVGFTLNCTQMLQREKGTLRKDRLFWAQVWLIQKGSYGYDSVISSRNKNDLSGGSQLNFALSTEDVSEESVAENHEMYLHINHNCGVKPNKKRYATKVVEVGDMDKKKLKLLGTINLP